MANFNIYDTEIEEWLKNFPNKSKMLRQAVIEFKQRHYENIYFRREEIEHDIIRLENKATKLKRMLKELDEKIKVKENDKGKEKKE